MNAISNVILVHGAWADGSSWADVAAVQRAIAIAEGEVVLVGHSYAGAVISEAGNNPKVARLVYVDAFAPDAGESAGMLFAKFESAPLNAEIRPDSQGFLSVTRAGIFNLFGQDLDEDEKLVVHATQGPINGAALGGVITQAAWQSRPSCYLVGSQDHTGMQKYACIRPRQRKGWLS